MRWTRFFDHLALFLMAAFFCAAVILLVQQFSSVSIHEVAMHLAALPMQQVLAAAGLTVLSYLVLACYDFFALRYVHRRLRLRDILFASFTAYALSNNVGVQFLSGGSMRYRIYSRFGLGAIEVGAVVVFCATAYALGVITVGGVLALSEPAVVATLLRVPQALVVGGGILLVGISLAYLALCALWRHPVAVAGLNLRPPSFALAVAQIAVASIDAVLAGTVVYVLMPGSFGIGYQAFLSIYLIAATASVLSLVPGGLGVFETAVTMLTAPPSKAAALSAFFVYRLIYFITPLIVALLSFSLYEIRRRREVPDSHNSL